MEENKMVELLEKIERNGRRQNRLAAAQCAFTLVAALCCAGAVVMIGGLLPAVNTVLQQVQVVLGDMQQVSGQLAHMDFAGVVTDMDTLVISARESLALTTAKLEALDVEALNQAIYDLSRVVEPLTKLFNAFS